MDQAQVAITVARIVEIDEITNEVALRICRTTVANDPVVAPTKAKAANRIARTAGMAQQHRQHK
jgi:hypothetical protein